MVKSISIILVASGLAVAVTSFFVARNYIDKHPEKFTSSKAEKQTAIQLEWRYGNFKPASDCKEDRELVYVKSDGKSVTFQLPSKDYWGATHENPTMRCCAFYWDGSKYVGGFWEWQSPDRKNREFTNIKGNYGGWSAGKDAFLNAKRRAFVVCSKDGRHRTNIVETGK